MKMPIYNIPSKGKWYDPLPRQADLEITGPEQRDFVGLVSFNFDIEEWELNFALEAKELVELAIEAVSLSTMGEYIGGGGRSGREKPLIFVEKARPEGLHVEMCGEEIKADPLKGEGRMIEVGIFDEADAEDYTVRGDLFFCPAGISAGIEDEDEIVPGVNFECRLDGIGEIRFFIIADDVIEISKSVLRDEL